MTLTHMATRCWIQQRSVYGGVSYLDLSDYTPWLPPMGNLWCIYWKYSEDSWQLAHWSIVLIHGEHILPFDNYIYEIPYSLINPIHRCQKQVSF